MTISKSAAIASIQTAGFSVDSKCRDKSFLDAIMIEVKQALPYNLMMPFDPKCDIGCLDMKAIFNEFSARKDFDDFFPDKYSVNCDQTIVQIINTSSAMAFNEMLTMNTVYRNNLQNALDQQSFEGEVVCNSFFSNKSKAIIRMQNAIKCTSIKLKNDAILRQQCLNSATLKHIRDQKRLKKTKSLQICQDQSKLVKFSRDSKLIASNILVAYPLFTQNQAELKFHSTRIAQLSATSYMCFMSFEVLHKVTQQPPRDLSCVNFLQISEDEYLKYLYTHKMETTIQKCLISYSFVLNSPRSIVQDQIELQKPSQSIEMINLQREIVWTKSTEMFNAVYTDHIPEEVNAWIYNQRQPKEAYYCIQCVLLIKVASMNLLTCEHMICCQCVDLCTKSQCPICHKALQIAVESKISTLQLQTMAVQGNLRNFESRCRQALKVYDYCYMQVQTFINLKVNRRNEDLQSDLDELARLRLKEQKHKAKKLQVQQLQAQLSMRPPVQTSKLIQARDNQTQQRAGLISNALAQQLLSDQAKPSQQSTQQTMTLTRNQNDNQVEEVKQMQHLQDNVLNQQQVVNRTTVHEDGQVTVTKEVFQCQTVLLQQASSHHQQFQDTQDPLNHQETSEQLHYLQNHSLYDQVDQQQLRLCNSEPGQENPEDRFRAMNIGDCGQNELVPKENISMIDQDDEDTEDAKQGIYFIEEDDEDGQYEDNQLVFEGPPVCNSWIHKTKSVEEQERIFHTMITNPGDCSFGATWTEFFLQENAWRNYMQEANRPQ